MYFSSDSTFKILRTRPTKDTLLQPFGRFRANFLNNYKHKRPFYRPSADYFNYTKIHENICDPDQLDHPVRTRKSEPPRHHRKLSRSKPLSHFRFSVRFLVGWKMSGVREVLRDQAKVPQNQVDSVLTPLIVLFSLFQIKFNLNIFRHQR